MTIHHIGTEDIHFVPAGVPSVNVSGGGTSLDARFRSDWVRCSLQATVSLGTDERWRGPLSHMPVSLSAFWWTCQLWQAGGAIIGATSLIDFVSGDTARLRLFGHNGELPTLYRYNNDDTLVLLATGNLPMPSFGRRGKIDIYVNLGTGEFTLYADRVPILSLIGDLTNSEYSEINKYDMRGSTGNANFSEVCWRSEDTRKMIGVKGIWPVGGGNAMAWTGAKEDVDEIVNDDSDANYTDTPGLIQQYTTPPLPSGLTGNVVVGGVMLGARLATNPTNAAIDIRVGGTDYFSDSYGTAGSPENRMYIWEVSPDSGVGWTQAEVNDVAFNIGVEST